MKPTDRINRLKLSGPPGLILLFFVSSVIIVLFVNFHERRQGRQFAESKAMLLLDRNPATHSYFTQDLNSSDYYCKECAVNARSPFNEADEYVSAISIRIPLGEAYAATTFRSVILSLFFVVLLLFAMAAHFLLARERKRAEVKVESLAKFPSENPNPVLRISNEGVILYANEASEDVLETWDRKEGEKLPAECHKRIEAAVQSGGASEFEFECSNGRIFSVMLSPVADGGYVNIYGLDITKRSRSEEILQHERDKLTAILDSMQDGVYIVNENYDVEYLNPVLIKEFGELEGKKCYEYFHDRNEACPWCKNSDVFAGKTVRWQWSSAKNHKTYDLIDTPLRNADGSISKLEMFRDITDLHEAETALYWESSVNKALAHLSNVLNKPYYSFEEISDFVLAHAKRLTGSKFGFAGYIDEQTGYLVCPTMTKEVWKQCRIQGKDIVFKEFNGLWGWALNERKSVLVLSLIHI